MKGGRWNRNERQGDKSFERSKRLRVRMVSEKDQGKEKKQRINIGVNHEKYMKDVKMRQRNDTRQWKEQHMKNKEEKGENTKED